MLRNLIAPAMTTTASSADLRRALDAIDLAALEAEAARLESERGRLFEADATDDEIERADRAISAAWRAVERATARRKMLAAQLDNALARDQDAERRAAYEAAKRMAAAAAAALAAEYPKLADQLVDLLRRVAMAQAAVQASNAALPLGEVPILDPELTVRGYPTEPREMVGVTDAGEEWRYSPHFVTKVPDHFAEHIETLDGRRGTLRRFGGGFDEVQKVKLQRVTFLEGRAAVCPEPLAATIALPGLRIGEPPLWSGEGIRGLAWFGAAQPGADAAAVLKRVAELAAARHSPVRDPRPASTRSFEIRVVTESDE